ncbi:MAG: lipocalin-like domain-containing protein [Muribaculaceae bacterium]|nr:lipocalin-like domain-containing protein [Muribaculaceae bacterium]
MKKSYNILLAFVAMLLTCACTHNNGDIGPLFGTWALDCMSIDGEPQPQPEDVQSFLLFQSNVVKAERFDSRNTLLNYHVGTWERDGDRLDLDFNHRDDANEPGTGIYSAPEWLHFTDRGITQLTIVNLHSGRMELRQTTPAGQTITYDLHKTH